MKYIIFFTLFVAGCASTQAVKISSKSYSAKSENCKIDVLTQKPNKAFEEIALLNAKQEISGFTRPITNAFRLLPDVKKKACLAGGDAIIITSSKEGGINFGGPADRASLSATVIKYSK